MGEVWTEDEVNGSVIDFLPTQKCFIDTVLAISIEALLQCFNVIIESVSLISASTVLVVENPGADFQLSFTFRVSFLQPMPTVF